MSDNVCTVDGCEAGCDEKARSRVEYPGHPKLDSYPITAAQAEAINQFKAAYAAVLTHIDAEVNQGGVNGRYAALAKTTLEESCMWMVKAISHFHIP